jgi:uncharacterized membrane protein YgdD (TMEM256/DUF423 family)
MCLTYWLKSVPCCNTELYKKLVQGIEFEGFKNKTQFWMSNSDNGLMVFICPFIIKMYHSLLLQVIFYLKFDKENWKILISGKRDIGYCCSRVQKYNVYLSKYSINIWQICTHQPVGGTLFILSWCTLCCVSKPDRISVYRYLQN